MLDGSGALTFDVMTWLSEQSIPLVRLDYQGAAVSVVGGNGFAVDLDKVRWQVETRNDPIKRLAFSSELIAAKFRSSLTTLRDVAPESVARHAAVATTEAGIDRIQNGGVGSIEELRTLEAVVAARYFAAWKGVPLKWQSRWKHPVPDEWLTIAPRQTSGKGRFVSNRNAKHPVNAMLNYAYGLLASQVHVEALAAGYDPRRGIMHHDRDDADAFAWVFDLMEPRRAQVDAAVFGFLMHTPLTGVDFVVRVDGVCRVGSQLARRLVGIVGRA